MSKQSPWTPLVLILIGSALGAIGTWAGDAGYPYVQLICGLGGMSTCGIGFLLHRRQIRRAFEVDQHN